MIAAAGGSGSGTVVAGLRASARDHPEAPAIVDGGTVITYARLLENVNRLSTAIRLSGVRPGDRVGVAVDRSHHAVTCMLATLRAGAAYVPLEARHPIAHLRRLVGDSGIRRVLGRRSVMLPQELDVEYVCLDAALAGSGWPPVADRAPDPELDSLAYTIYTSGSSGRPKGVLVPHRALATAARGLMARCGLGPSDRMLSFASLSWDTGGEEIYPTLLAGATLVIDRRTENGLIPSFLSVIRDHDISVVDLPTGFWNGLVDYLELTGDELPSTLRLVIIGGEEVRPAQVRAWSRLVGDYVTLLNTYGQTESVLVTHSAEIGGAFGRSLRDGDRVPIGSPLPHVRQRFANAVDGSVELLIGGPTVAWGYQAAPAITAGRFVPDLSGARVYRTGDLVRRRTDGMLEFIGRADRQIKIRGYRVEPEEIERALQACPGVLAAAVIPLERSTDLALAAAYVPSSDSSASAAGAAPAELAALLSDRLPVHLVPHTIVRIRELPLNSNGKVDYSMVRKLIEQQEAPDVDAAPPTVADEIAELAAQVLGRVCTVDDDFFDRGGDSLLAIRLISRVYRRFDTELTFADVFDRRTPRHLAELVRAGG